MKESMDLFEEIVNSSYFKRSSVILFLNKVDLLEEKLPRVPLTTYFKDYTGAQFKAHQDFSYSHF